MERYELKVKYEQIKSLMTQEQYQEAMEVCNTIDWDKSKNINMLCTAGEVYERCGLFEDSKAIYLRAYQLQPQSRIVIYRLAELSIKLREQEDSIHFYKLYEDAAPYDVNLFVLRYKIYRARGASTDVLLSILEELKENDYHERWAYELAKLYSVAGMIDKCVAECDEIDLWFGNGRYVRQALQLKQRYQALTPAQKQKLEASDPKPHKAEETISRRAEAERKQQETQAAYDSIKAQGADRAEEADRARRQAIDAAREARAAQLLAEAAEEGAREDAAHAEKDSAEFYGQGTWPQLHISRPEEIKTPVLKPPVIERAQRRAAEQQASADAVRPVADMAGAAEVQEKPDTAAAPKAAETEAAQKLPEMTEVRQAGRAKTEMTENDILAANIARILEGKSPRRITPDEPYEDDYISTASEEVYVEADDAGRAAFAGDSAKMEEEKSAVKSAEALKAKKAEKKVRLEEDDFVDDYEMENPPEEDTDTTEEDDAAFARRESAFHRMWRMTSSVVGRKPKGTTVIAKEQEYDIQIKPVVVSRYDTLNLQKELAKSIRAIMNATEKSEVEKTMEDIDRSMEESNIPKLIQTKRLNLQEVKDALQQENEKAEMEEAAEQEASEETLVQEAEALDSRMQEMLGEEYDGQLRMVLEQEKVEKQITGQMSFGDVFVNEQQRSLVAAKKKALAQTEAYIDQLAVVMPYIGEREEVPVEDETNNTEEALQKARDLIHSAKVEDRADIEQIITRLSNLLAQTDSGAAEETAKATEAAEEEAAAAIAEAEEETAAEEVEAAIEEAEEEAEAAIEAAEEEAEAAIAEAEEETAAEEAEAAIEEAEEEAAAEAAEAAIEEAEEEAEAAIEAAEEAAAAAIEEAEEEAAAEAAEAAIEEAEEEAEAAIAEAEEEAEAAIAEAEEEAEAAIAEAEEETAAEEAEAAIEEAEKEAAAEEAEAAIEEAAEAAAETKTEAAEAEAEVWQDRLLSKPLSKEEQQKILSYFMKFDGIEAQIISFMEREKDNGENFVVMGAEGSGRMSLALRLMKVIIKSTPGVPKRMAKMSALALNEKPVNAVFAKIGAGTLIVEHAESLEQDACTELLRVMDAYAHAVRVILIGETEPMEALFANHPSLETYFTYCFHLHNYSNNELVEFAKAYAETQGYCIDELAVLALYTRLAAAKTNKQVVMLGDVKEIVNDAIERSRNSKGLRHVLDNLMMKNVDDDGNLLLRERDFELKE